MWKSRQYKLIYGNKYLLKNLLHVVFGVFSVKNCYFAKLYAIKILYTTLINIPMYYMISCHSFNIYHYYVYICIQFIVLSMLAFGTCDICCSIQHTTFEHGVYVKRISTYKHNDILLVNVIMHIEQTYYVIFKEAEWLTNIPFYWSETCKHDTLYFGPELLLYYEENKIIKFIKFEYPPRFSIQRSSCKGGKYNSKLATTTIKRCFF